MPTHQDSNLAAVGPRQLQDLLRQFHSCQGSLDKSQIFRELIRGGAVRDLTSLLPFCFSLQGKPYTLADHAPFGALYRTAMPKNIVFRTGRQVAKSTNLAAHGVLLANCIPFFRTLYVTPLYEQIRRFSNNYVRPFVETSPLRDLWMGPGTENSVLQRSFANRAMMVFSFALMDTERVRGISADRCALDEIQDLDPDHIPIIRETMSHSDYSLMQMTGTPKTLDNCIEGIWSQSSQAEWFVKCTHCSFWNIPSREYHIEGMIGPWHHQISEQYPGTVCYRCRQPISPRFGVWVHKYPDRRQSFAGYHIPQIILPLHFARPNKWGELLYKRDGGNNTSTNTFWNEVLGEGVDTGQKLVSETELRAASTLNWHNNFTTPDPLLMQQVGHYKMRVMAIDWGGGGEEGVSFTAAALLGITPTGQIHVLWGKRFVLSQEHLREARELLHWMKAFRVELIAHDYTGAGVVRETVMVQAGFDLNRIMPIQLVRSASASLLHHVQPTVLHNRAHFRLDKTRSLLYTCQAIKTGLLRFFKYDKMEAKPGVVASPGLIPDFLALVEEKSQSRLAGDIYTITRNTMLSDDFAQAVNLGCAALWHANGAWPNFADAAGVARISSAQVLAASGYDPNWEDRVMGGFFNQP